MADTTVTPEVKIPDMCVDFGNGANITYVFDGACYPAASQIDHPDLTAKIVELSGNVWSEKVANDYIKNIDRVGYYDAVDILRDTGMTLKEAVAFLAGETKSDPEKDDSKDNEENE